MTSRNNQKRTKVLAIIPARAGSKGVPQKNTKMLVGQPLITYTIRSAQKSKLIGKLILSSNDDKAISIGKQFNVDVPFKRPDSLSENNTGSLEVVQHSIDFFEKQDEYFDAILLLQPTTPFREDGFIDRAIDKFINTNCDALVSVVPVPHQFNPHWVFEPDDDDHLKISTGENQIIKRRQDLPKTYIRDGSIYITKTKVLKKGSFYGKRLSYIESDPKYYVNIDTIEDWKKAEELFSNQIMENKI